MADNLIFKYGMGDMPAAAANTAGTVYIKKTVDGKAQMFIDEPVGDGSSPDRLQIGGEIFIGDPDEAGEDYEVVINPEGDILEGIVTGLNNSGNAMAYTIRVVEVEESSLDSYTPTDADSNIITLVVKA